MQATRPAPLLLLASLLVATSLPVVAQQFITNITVGNGPIGSRVDAGTNHIYVLNETDSTVMDIDGATNTVVHTVILPGPISGAGAINRVTRKGYVSNQGTAQSPGKTVSVIDLVTYKTTTLTVEYAPGSTAVNPVTNRIYVANECGTDPTCSFTTNGTVSVINGATNSVVATITAGIDPRFVAVNPVTNKIYVANRNTNNVTVIDGATNTVIKTIPTGKHPDVIAVNRLTNKLYVNNQAVNTVTVVNGASDSVITTLTVGNRPFDSSANLVTNKIYVVNQDDNTVSVIDGASDSVVKTVTVGTTPSSVEADVPTNKIYVSNSGSDTVTMIDGSDPNYSTTSVNVGTQPEGLSVNPVTNRVYVANFGSNNVSVIGGASTTAVQFVAVLPPCRLVDTRNPDGEFGGPALQAKGTRSFTIPDNQDCNIPSSAAAYSLNVTVVPFHTLGYLSVWPTGEDQPLVSTLNSYDGRVKANAAIVPAGDQGAISFYVTDTTHLVLDIDGYFIPGTLADKNGHFTPPGNSTQAFYPLPPCRVADTRNPNGPLGGPFLQGGVNRDFPVLDAAACDIPISAQSYSLNFTVVPHGKLGYLTVCPTPSDPLQNCPVVSTLNADQGKVTANAAIVPAGTGGAIRTFPSNDTDLIIDINGYFGPQGAGGLSLYPVAPCRVLDTRPLAFRFQLDPPVDVLNSSCAPAANSQAYVFNATVVPQGGLGYLTLWPDGQDQPLVSTLNAYDGVVSSNMALVPASTAGKVDAWAQPLHPSDPTDLTNLILDISGYFAP